MKATVVCFFASLTVAGPLPPPLESFLLSHVTDAIPGRYIVTLKTGTSVSTLHDVLTLTSHPPIHVYNKGSLHGFASELTNEEVTSLYNHPNVENIEMDTLLTPAAHIEQADASWGLARLSHREKGSNTYFYDDSAGEGVCAYILDTGVYTEHAEFEDRAEVVANFVELEDNDDFNGHGTHCAAIVGGKTYGVAKKAKVLGVKVMDEMGSGKKSDIIAGIDFMLEDSRNRTQECPKGFVVNISLGAPFSKVFNEAVKSMVDAGIFVAVAAGNEANDASRRSPASEKSVCTVAAMNSNDEHAPFSNFGSSVDIYAPGVNVLSAWIGEETSTKSANGTSMASPHVAGLAAYVLGMHEPIGPQELCLYLKATATKGRLSNPGVRTPNLIAFNGNTKHGGMESPMDI